MRAHGLETVHQLGMLGLEFAVIYDDDTAGTSFTATLYDDALQLGGSGHANNDVLGFLTWDVEALCPRAQYPVRKVSFTAGINSSGGPRSMQATRQRAAR